MTGCCSFFIPLDAPNVAEKAPMLISSWAPSPANPRPPELRLVAASPQWATSHEFRPRSSASAAVARCCHLWPPYRPDRPLDGGSRRATCCCSSHFQPTVAICGLLIPPGEGGRHWRRCPPSVANDGDNAVVPPPQAIAPSPWGGGGRQGATSVGPPCHRRHSIRVRWRWWC